MKLVFLVPATMIGFLINGGCGHSPVYYMSRAEIAATRGQYADAEIEYNRVIQLEPKNGQAWYRLGSVLAQAGKTRPAFDALVHAAALLPERDDVAAKMGRLVLESYLADTRHSTALYEKANDVSNRLLSHDAQSFDGLYLKASLAAADRKYSDAENLFSRANQIYPFRREVILPWTQVLFQDGRAKEAEELALHMIDTDKGDGAIYDLLYVYYVRSKRTSDAEKILQARVNNNPADSEGVLHLAAFYASVSRETEMQAVLRRMLDNPGSFPHSRLDTGDFFARLKRWDEALQQYREGARALPSGKLLYQKKIVDVLIAKGSGDQAGIVVDQILKEHPDDETEGKTKASLLLATRYPGDLEKATELLRRVVQHNPGNAEDHFRFGQALLAGHRENEARGQFQEAARLQATYLDPLIALVQLSQNENDFQATLRYSQRILRSYPNLTRVRIARALGLMNTGMEEQARRELADLARTSPKEGEVRLQLALLDLRQQKLREAEGFFRSLIRTNDDDGRALSGLVETLVQEHQVDQAVTLVKGQIAKAPNSVALHLVLAKTAAETQRYDLAIEEYLKVVALSPKSMESNLALGTVYFLKGDYPEAIQWLGHARDLSPGDPEPIRRLAGALARSGDIQQAMDDYHRVLRLRPNDPDTLNNIAYLIADMGGNLDEALSLAKKAVALDTKQSAYADTLGWIYLKNHLVDSAIQIFRGLTKMHPDNATFHYHLGMALLEQGDRSGARSEFNAALGKTPSDDVRMRVQTALSRF